jgi:hypothetical protein
MKKHLVDVILDVLDELGATDSHPRHRSDFNSIIEHRWKALGNPLDPRKDFGQAVSAELHRHSSDSSAWQKAKARKREARDLFKMHGDGFWSVRSNAQRDKDEHLISRL